mmetsp:Transcript_7254/g.21405  ORF Transcript_7254/g.21405 Transcript_7254/m.21405 type:complete len:112 (-) Transcript_7254:32-367(-)
MYRLLALLTTAAAFRAPRATAPRLRALRATTIKEAFADVQAAATLFPEGSESRGVADSMVARLEAGSLGTWSQDDMEIIDECLVDDSEACVKFQAAMIALRELHERSPGYL